MEDHHVDRPEVDAEQSVELTGTNRSNPLDPNAVLRDKPGPPSACSGKRQPQHQPGGARAAPRQDTSPRAFANPICRPPPCARGSGPRINPPVKPVGLKVHRGSLRPRPCADAHGVSGRFGQPGGHSEGQNTRSHPELGRENPQRRWYCRSSGGRAGRRQARQTPLHPRSPAPSPDPSNNAPVPRSSRRRPPNPPPRGRAAR